MIHHGGAFLLLASVVIAVPGPDTALTIRNALLGGRRGGVHTAAGVCSGQLIWVLATAAGVASLVADARPVFVGLKAAGAAYLIYLGLRALSAAMRLRPRPSGPTLSVRSGELTASAAFRQGLLCNLSNPKAAVFFLSLLPQFVSGTRPYLATLLLGFGAAVLTFASLMAYARTVARAAGALRNTRGRRVLDAVSGVALVGVGVWLATDRISGVRAGLK